MEVKASLNFTRIGAFKARRVANLIKGRGVNEASNILSYSSLKASRLIQKLLSSALANAEQKKVIDIDQLYIKNVIVNKASSLKRHRPIARGRANPIEKQQSHIELILSEK